MICKDARFRKDGKALRDEAQERKIRRIYAGFTSNRASFPAAKDGRLKHTTQGITDTASSVTTLKHYRIADSIISSIPIRSMCAGVTSGPSTRYVGMSLSENTSVDTELSLRHPPGANCG
jgi:hypothetical protein